MLNLLLPSAQGTACSHCHYLNRSAVEQDSKKDDGTALQENALVVGGQRRNETLKNVTWLCCRGSTCTFDRDVVISQTCCNLGGEVDKQWGFTVFIKYLPPPLLHSVVAKMTKCKWISTQKTFLWSMQHLSRTLPLVLLHSERCYHVKHLLEILPWQNKRKNGVDFCCRFAEQMRQMSQIHDGTLGYVFILRRKCGFSAFWDLTRCFVSIFSGLSLGVTLETDWQP